MNNYIVKLYRLAIIQTYHVIRETHQSKDCSIIIKQINNKNKNKMNRLTVDHVVNVLLVLSKAHGDAEGSGLWTRLRWPKPVLWTQLSHSLSSWDTCGKHDMGMSVQWTFVVSKIKTICRGWGIS